MAKKDFSLSRGLKDVVIAEIISDDETGYRVSETIEKLIPAGTITMSADSEKTETYFDNVVFASIGSESATTVSIEGARLKPTALAKITGKTIDDATGAVIDNGVYTEKYFALGARIGMLDGSEALVWFLKGTFAIPEETGRTIDDSTDADGMTLEFSAISTSFQFGGDLGVKRMIVDTTLTEFLAGQDWFKQVVTPENLATICKKKGLLTTLEINPNPVTLAQVGTPVTLTAVPDVEQETVYTWSGTNGTFNATDTKSVEFTPTGTGLCTVTLRAINNGVELESKVEFTATE